MYKVIASPNGPLDSELSEYLPVLFAVEIIRSVLLLSLSREQAHMVFLCAKRVCPGMIKQSKVEPELKCLVNMPDRRTRGGVGRQLDLTYLMPKHIPMGRYAIYGNVISRVLPLEESFDNNQFLVMAHSIAKAMILSGSRQSSYLFDAVLDKMLDLDELGKNESRRIRLNFNGKIFTLGVVRYQGDDHDYVKAGLFREKNPNEFEMICGQAFVLRPTQLPVDAANPNPKLSSSTYLGPDNKVRVIETFNVDPQREFQRVARIIRYNSENKLQSQTTVYRPESQPDRKVADVRRYNAMGNRETSRTTFYNPCAQNGFARTSDADIDWTAILEKVLEVRQYESNVHNNFKTSDIKRSSISPAGVERIEFLYEYFDPKPENDYMISKKVEYSQVDSPNVMGLKLPCKTQEITYEPRLKNHCLKWERKVWHRSFPFSLSKGWQLVKSLKIRSFTSAFTS